MSNLIDRLYRRPGTTSSENDRYEAAEEIKLLRGIVDQHDLCHDLHGKVDVVAFADGCAAEQVKTYGRCPDRERIATLERELAEARADSERNVEHCLDHAYQKLKAEGGLVWMPRRVWRELRHAAIDAARDADKGESDADY